MIADPPRCRGLLRAGALLGTFATLSAAGLLLADGRARAEYAERCGSGPAWARRMLGGRAAARRYRLVVLPTAGGNESYHGGALNAAGWVVGGTQRPDGRTIPFLWRRGRGDDPASLLTLPSGARGGRAMAVADQGAVAGYLADGKGEAAVVWTPHEARALPRSPRFPHSVAVGIGERGGVVGRQYKNRSASGDWAKNPSCAFYWEPGLAVPLLLPSPPGCAPVGGALALGDAGDVVGWARARDGHVAAIRWSLRREETSGKLVGALARRLPTLPGGRTSRALAVNRRGLMVGACDDAPTFALPWTRLEREDEHAVAWWGGRVYDLGRPTGAKGCRANAVNGRGLIVGEYRRGGGRYSEGHRRGFLWDTAHGMRDLNDLVPSSPDWTVEGGLAIDDRGEILAYGISSPSKGNFVRLFLLVPEPTPHQ